MSSFNIQDNNSNIRLKLKSFIFCKYFYFIFLYIIFQKFFFFAGTQLTRTLIIIAKVSLKSQLA